MSNQKNLLIDMLDQVAQALPPRYLCEMIFIGGCTTALLLDVPKATETIRATYDVDLIVDISTQTDWYALEQELRGLGFKNDMEDGVVCRFKLNQLIVDFMPVNQDILGFTNRWYEESIRHTSTCELPSGVMIKILLPAYFLATKFEAYFGRGKNDPLTSKDIEDILNVLAGRTSIVEEIYRSDSAIRSYLRDSFLQLSSHDEWLYVLQGNVAQGFAPKVSKSIHAIINNWSRAF